jgi:integrase
VKAPRPFVHGLDWVIRVRMPNGARPRIAVAPATMPERRAVERAEEWWSERDARIADWLKRHEKEARTGGTTVRELGEQWTTGKLLEKHGRVNRLRVKKSADWDACLLGRCYSAIATTGRDFGSMLVEDVTEQDVEAVLRQAPTKGVAAASQTIRNYYSTLHRLFDLAERPCRLRERGTNPVDRSLRPVTDDAKVYSFILPDEFLAVMRLRGDVRDGEILVRDGSLVRWKVLLVLGAYLGLRKANLTGLRWCDVDLESLSYTARRTKTGIPILSELHFPCVAFVLARWKAVSKPADDAEPIVRLSKDEAHDAAKILRALLRAAGVKREVLFSDDASVEPIRLHDLRATFVTWAKRDGRTEDFITSRTGHLTKEMTERYSRLAMSISALRFTPFPDVSTAIPELAVGPKLAPSRGGPIDSGEKSVSDHERRRSARWCGPWSSNQAGDAVQSGSPLDLAFWAGDPGDAGPLLTPRNFVGPGPAGPSALDELRGLRKCVAGLSLDVDALEVLVAEDATAAAGGGR